MCYPKEMKDTKTGEIHEMDFSDCVLPGGGTGIRIEIRDPDAYMGYKDVGTVIIADGEAKVIQW